MQEKGGWLGGIVPYGYRQDGEDKTARLVLSKKPIPGCKLSEVDVVRRIFQKVADGQSCVRIADNLNHLGVPTRYIIDGRKVLQRATSGLWRAARIRNLIVNATYKGVFEYGKRRTVRDESSWNLKSKRHLKAVPPEEWIRVSCPEIVANDLWERANAALKQNQLLAMAHPKHDYLLRGMIKCACCGLNFFGFGSFYRCNGKRRKDAQRCPAPSVRRTDLEAGVWSQIEGFLRKPAALLAELKLQMGSAEDAGKQLRDEIRELEAALSRKEEESDRIHRRHFKGLLSEAKLEKFLREMEQEAESIKKDLAERRERAQDREANARALNNAGGLLEKLRTRLDQQLPFPERRRLVEVLVSQVIVSRTKSGEPQAQISYNFDAGVDRLLKWRDDPTGLPPVYTGTRADINCMETEVCGTAGLGL